jgi:HEAT repeat protein
MLFDRQGEDSYTGTSTNQSQASGHDGGRREYGSIALLLDLAGKDVYSQGWTNNSLWTKPNHGAGLDGEFWSAPTCRRFAFSAPVRTEQRQSASKLAHSKVDVRHPTERLLRRATRDWETDAEKADSEAADKELNDRAAEALPYLLSRLGSPSVMVSVKVEQLVDKLGTNAVPLLIQGIKVAGNDDVARRCAFFLGRFASATNAIPVLLPLLTNETTRTTALYTLGHLRAREAFGPAMRGLGDEKEMVRLRAAQALGRIGDRRAVPQLIGMLDDPLWDVRYAAEDALVRLGAPSRQLLRAAFADATPLARRYIASALVRLDDPAGRSLAWKAERQNERK